MNYLDLFDDPPEPVKRTDFLDLFDDVQPAEPVRSEADDAPSEQQMVRVREVPQVLAPKRVNILRELLNRTEQRQQKQQNLLEVRGRGPQPPKPLRRRGYKVSGKGGTPLQRGAWSMQMHLSKTRKRKFMDEVRVLQLLGKLEKQCRHASRTKIRLFRRGHLFNKKGLLNTSSLKLRAGGNRFSSSFSMAHFLTAAFGAGAQQLKSLQGKRHRSRGAAALALDTSPSAVGYMRYVVAGAVIARQAHLLSRLYAMCRQSPPAMAGVRTCFDETSQIISANVNDSGQEKGSFQICVLKKTLLLCWVVDGEVSMLKVPLVTWS